MSRDSREGLRLLLLARECFKNAGSVKTLKRVRAAISSAKGACRAEGYRNHRKEKAA